MRQGFDIAHHAPYPSTAPSTDPSRQDLELAAQLSPTALALFSQAAGEIILSPTVGSMLGKRVPKFIHKMEHQRTTGEREADDRTPEFLQGVWRQRVDIARIAEGPLPPVLAKLPATLHAASVIKGYVSRGEEVPTEALIPHADALRTAAPLAVSVMEMSGSKLPAKGQAAVALLRAFGSAARVVGLKGKMDTKIAEQVAKLVNEHRPEIITGLAKARVSVVGPLSRQLEAILGRYEHPQDQLAGEARYVVDRIWDRVMTSPNHQPSSREVGRAIREELTVLQDPKYRDWVQANLPMLSSLGLENWSVQNESLLAIASADIMRALELTATPPGQKLSSDIELRLLDIEDQSLKRHRVAKHIPSLITSRDPKTELAKLAYFPQLLRSARDLLPRDRAHAKAIVEAIDHLLTIQPAQTRR